MGDGTAGPRMGREAGPRCIALVGPFGSGKTTLLEAIMERTGAIKNAGNVAAGSTLGDASSEARAHHMSVEPNIAETHFLGDTYTLIDCPGSIEFLHETDPVLAGCDLAIVVCEADEKKIPALQITLKQLEERGIPRVLFLNKIDKAGTRVRETLKMLQTASTVPLVLRQIPIWKDGIAIGYIDLALERAHIYREHCESEVIPIPSGEIHREVEARFEMLEKIADYDDALMEELLADIPPPRDQVFQDLATEMRAGLICPVFIGSAERANGITRLLKAIRHEAPGIAETNDRLGFTPNGDTVVQVLKTLHTQHGGKLSVVRVLAGKVADGQTLTRADGSSDRVSSVMRMSGRDLTKRGEAGPGETVALAKVEVAKTGDTLTSAKTSAIQCVKLEPISPVMAVAVKPRDRKDDVKLSTALTRLAEEDPGLRVVHDQDTGETLVEGQGEMHLRVSIERLTGKFGVAVETHDPTVPYKESIKGSVSVRGRHKKQSGGHGQFGDVVLSIKGLPRSSGFVFSESISGGVVPRNYFSAIEEGVVESLKTGPLGFPVVDVAVELTDGSYHAVDSSDQAFKTAAGIGMREGLPQCNPVLLEPILKVSITTPSDTTARINQIVTGRRGQLLGFDGRPGWANWDVVEALIPQSEMKGLIVEIRSATAGVGSYVATFEHLAELGGRLASDIIERHKREHA
ncbi:MAG: elongation factor G [Hyphomicrobiaceae bacterium]|nr:elongation factor G [Hyphomicrobiaceae bacterium]